MPLGGSGIPGGLEINWYTSASIHTVKENTEASVFVSNEIGLVLIMRKLKYMVMS